MSQIVVESMQWNTLQNITDVEPVGEADAECLEEVRRALEKHNCLERFGLTLLHSHFDLADDELMLETTDLDKREHWVRPVSRSFLEENGFTAQTTVVGFDEEGFKQQCGCLARPVGHLHS